MFRISQKRKPNQLFGEWREYQLLLLLFCRKRNERNVWRRGKILQKENSPENAQ
jgi:hypothetical protein